MDPGSASSVARPEPWLGLVVTSCALAIVGLAGLVAGALASPAVIEGIARLLALESIALADAGELGDVAVGLAVALAMPAAIAWLATLVHRVRRGRNATAGRVALYVGLPALAVGLGLALRVLWMLWAFRAMQAELAPQGLWPTLRAADLSPADWGIRGGAIAAIAVLAIAARAPARVR